MTNAKYFYSSALLGTLLLGSSPVIAAQEEIKTYSSISEDTLVAQLVGQVNNVSELRDVSPSDWAYEALRNLSERYGCISGYPDGTFRGQKTVSRYEFAAGLNNCLKKIEELISTSPRGIGDGDLETVQRLTQDFQAELSALGARVDSLEASVQNLEDNQFSTTTKLVGEVAFNLSHLFDGPNDNAQVTLTDKIRLQFVTSFTGKDKLYTRLTAGNIGDSFATEIGSNEGRFAFDGATNNNVTIDRLHYVFPVGDNLQITAMASLGGHHFYADTFNSGLEAGGGANGSLSRFGERNPIYRLGLGGQGIGARYKLGKLLELSAGYLARGGNNPTEKAGLFNGNYSLMGQLVVKPTDKLKFGATYIHGYDISTAAFNFGGTGTNFANLGGLGFDNPVSSNSYGVEGQWDISSKFSLRAWGGYTNTQFIGLGSGDIWNYSLAAVLKDLGKEGSMAALIVGAEPYLGGLKIPEASKPANFTNDLPLHIEAFYKYNLNDNISITPGVIWLTTPNQNEDNDSAIIGTVRTTFSF